VLTAEVQDDGVRDRGPAKRGAKCAWAEAHLEEDLRVARASRAQLGPQQLGNLASGGTVRAGTVPSSKPAKFSWIHSPYFRKGSPSPASSDR
jgi:hypothetical protein